MAIVVGGGIWVVATSTSLLVVRRMIGGCDVDHVVFVWGNREGCSRAERMTVYSVLESKKTINFKM